MLGGFQKQSGTMKILTKNHIIGRAQFIRRVIANFYASFVVTHSKVLLIVILWYMVVSKVSLLVVLLNVYPVIHF